MQLKPQPQPQQQQQLGNNSAATTATTAPTTTTTAAKAAIAGNIYTSYNSKRYTKKINCKWQHKLQQQQQSQQ